MGNGKRYTEEQIFKVLKETDTGMRITCEAHVKLSKLVVVKNEPR